MQIVPQMKLSGVYLDFVDFIFILVVFVLSLGELVWVLFSVF